MCIFKCVFSKFNLIICLFMFIFTFFFFFDISTEKYDKKIVE